MSPDFWRGVAATAITLFVVLIVMSSGYQLGRLDPHACPAGARP